jgi:hypothetical protein
MTAVRLAGLAWVAIGLVTATHAWADEAPPMAEAPVTPEVSSARDTPPNADVAPGADVTPTADEDALPFKLSLPTQDDRQAWRTAGFRMQLGVQYGEFAGQLGAPSGRLLGAVVRVGGRLDADWSLLASFQYASASAVGGLAALRFVGTIDPTWHFAERWDLAVGVGFAGIVEGGRTGRAEYDAAGLASQVDSYTLPSARHPVGSCSGVGAAGLTRLGWMVVLGPLASTGLQFEVDGQWTACVQVPRVGAVEPDTAQVITRRQWWTHVGGTLAWVVAWR